MNSALEHFLHKTLPVFAAAAALCGSAGAAVLYSQGPVDDGAALLAQYSITGEFGAQNADSYVLTLASVVTGVRWWGTRPVDTGQFVVRLFGDLAGSSDVFSVLVGSEPSRQATSLTDNTGAAIYQFDLTLSSPLSLSAGSGHVSVLFDSESTPDWAWLEGLGPDGISAYRGQDGVAWDFSPPDLAFALLGDPAPHPMPEPGAVALMLLAGLAAARVRRGSPGSMTPGAA